MSVLLSSPHLSYPFFFFTSPATTEIYTLSLHDALPISCVAEADTDKSEQKWHCATRKIIPRSNAARRTRRAISRSEEHTSELQSRLHLVCRLLLEKKKKTIKKTIHTVLYKKNYKHKNMY